MGRKWQDENPSRAAQLRRNWYLKNRASEIAKAKIRNKKNRKMVSSWLKSLKTTLGCNRCGETHPAVLDLHHKDKSTKEINIAYAAEHGWSISRILKEIEKCEVLCSNYHRKHHYDERMAGVSAL